MPGAKKGWDHRCRRTSALIGQRWRALCARSATFHAAIENYVSRIPYGEVLSTAQHISTDLNLRPVTEAEMASALTGRNQATTAERDIYASYILEIFLTELEKHAGEIVYQFSIGAEPLPFETGSKLRQDTIYEVAALAARHPRLRFQVLLASEHGNQSLCTLARELRTSRWQVTGGTTCSRGLSAK